MVGPKVGPKASGERWFNEGNEEFHFLNCELEVFVAPPCTSSQAGCWLLSLSLGI